MDTYRVGFVLEQTLGHVTVTATLRSNVTADPQVRATWFLIPFAAPAALAFVPLLGTNWSLRSCSRAWLALRRAGAPRAFDALYFHTQITALFSVGLLRRSAGVLSLDATPRNYDALAAEYGHARGTESLERAKDLLYCRAFRAACHLVTFSDWARASLVRDYGVPAEKVTTLPPGTDLDLWASPPRQPPGAGRVRLLFVGGDFERKGGDLLLQVYRDRLAGTCELDIVTNAEVQRPPPGVRVHDGLTANSAPLRRLFALADIFVLPTRADCFSLVVTEAMAAGIPVITTPVGALGELVQPGKNGLLVAPDDGWALGAAIDRLIADASLRARMGAAGRRLAEERFDARVNVRRLLAIIKDAVDRRRMARP